EDDWNQHCETCVGVFLNGQAIMSPGPRGERIEDDSFLLLINASPEARKWTVSGSWGERWAVVIDTAAEPAIVTVGTAEVVAGQVRVHEDSRVLLRRIDG